VSTPPPTLYAYQCKSCKTVAVAAYESRGGKCIRCNVCRSPMPFLWSEPVTTDAHRALWARGLVYNPGESKPKKTLPACDTCGAYASILYGEWIVGVGLFCSAKCADDGVKKHEAALAPSAHLLATGE
jgi:hypothetical protein